MPIITEIDEVQPGRGTARCEACNVRFVWCRHDGDEVGVLRVRGRLEPCCPYCHATPSEPATSRSVAGHTGGDVR